MIEQETKYWNETWQGRIKDDGTVTCNILKYRKVMDYLWSKPNFFFANKLDIGCGPAQHAVTMAQLARGYKETWVGLDLSETAIAYATKRGMDAHCLNFLEWDGGNYQPFGVFFFWDSLEHFEDLKAVAAKVKELAAEKFTICGNIPLFHSPIHEKGGVENHMDIDVIRDFWNDCGYDKEWFSIYGTMGWPFLMFEVSKRRCRMSWSILLTGMPNSGKSTIAYELVQRHVRNALVIDGDKHREMQFLGEQLYFSKQDIMRNNDHVIKMARFAQDQEFNVIIAQITPYVEQRDDMRKALDNFAEFYIECPKEVRSKRPNYKETDIKYEHGLPQYTLHHTNSISVCASAVLRVIEEVLR